MSPKSNRATALKFDQCDDHAAQDSRTNQELWGEWIVSSMLRRTVARTCGNLSSTVSVMETPIWAGKGSSFSRG